MQPKWFAFLFGLAAGPLLAAPSGLIYTANELAASVSEISLVDGSVRNVSTSIAPHNVQTTPDGQRLLAVGASAHAGMGGASGRLLVFDTADLGKAPAELDAGRHPAHVVTDRAGKRAFVSDSVANAVHVFDLATRSQSASIATGRFPHGLRLSPEGKELFVANVKDGTVSVIELASLKETARIPVGRTPVQVGFTPDGREVYVSLRDENRVAVIDVASRKVVARIAVLNQPIQVYATPDSKRVYVANQGSANRPDRRVSVIDTASRKVIATVETGKGAHGVVVSDDGGYAFVSNIADNSVSAIDTATQRVVASYRVGAGPNGISYRSLP